jgi:hypothetical protein
VMSLKRRKNKDKAELKKLKKHRKSKKWVISMSDDDTWQKKSQKCKYVIHHQNHARCHLVPPIWAWGPTTWRKSWSWSHT